MICQSAPRFAITKVSRPARFTGLSAAMPTIVSKPVTTTVRHRRLQGAPLTTSQPLLFSAKWHLPRIVIGVGNQMAEQQIRFDDGASYEQMMGIWSRFAGEIFLDWLAPPLGLRWIDIGCGNGVFTELLVERCSPVEVQGIDPSEGQLAFARTRPASRLAKFRQGDAMALPFADSSFDAAVMALVLVFVPDPAKGISEIDPSKRAPAKHDPIDTDVFKR